MKQPNRPAGYTACLGGSMVEHQQTSFSDRFEDLHLFVVKFCRSWHSSIRRCVRLDQFTVSFLLLAFLRRC